MSDRKAVALTDELHDYVLAHSTPLDDVQHLLVGETRALGEVARMQVAPDQAALLTLLARATNARFAVEVGTFTGFSALAIARGLAPGGRLLCLDVSEEWTAIGRAHWERAGVADRIELRLGPAADTLRDLPSEPPVDLAFIDADKQGYLGYYEALLPRLRPGGLIAVDNVLWGGRVVDASVDDDDTAAIRAFNEHVAADDRVDRVMLAVADGMTIVCKR